MKHTLLISALIGLLLNSVLLQENAFAGESKRKTIRFYKINKDGITQKIRFTNRKARKPGCHNFVKKVRLHRAVQFAYESCRIYAKKNCAEESLMPFIQKKQKDLKTTELAEGFGWYPVGEHPRGEKAKSWICE